MFFLNSSVHENVFKHSKSCMDAESWVFLVNKDLNVILRGDLLGVEREVLAKVVEDDLRWEVKLAGRLFLPAKSWLSLGVAGITKLVGGCSDVFDFPLGHLVCRNSSCLLASFLALYSCRSTTKTTMMISKSIITSGRTQSMLSIQKIFCFNINQKHKSSRDQGVC